MNLEQRIRRIEEKVSSKKRVAENSDSYSRKDLEGDIFVAKEILNDFHNKLKNHVESPNPKELRNLGNNLLEIYKNVLELQRNNEY